MHAEHDNSTDCANTRPPQPSSIRRMVRWTEVEAVLLCPLVASLLGDYAATKRLSVTVTTILTFLPLLPLPMLWLFVWRQALAGRQRAIRIVSLLFAPTDAFLVASRRLLTSLDFAAQGSAGWRNLARLAAYVVTPWVVYGLLCLNLIYPVRTTIVHHAVKSEFRTLRVDPKHGDGPKIFLSTIGFVTVLASFATLHRDPVSRRPFIASGRFTVFSRGGFLLLSLWFAALVFLLGGIFEYASRPTGRWIAFIAFAITIPAYFYVCFFVVLGRIWFSCSACKYRMRWFENAHPAHCPRCNVALRWSS